MLGPLKPKDQNMTLLSCDPSFMQTADSLALNPCPVEPQPQWKQSLCNLCISSGRLIMVSALGDNAVCSHLMGKRKQKDVSCGLMSLPDCILCSPVPPGFKINPDTKGMDELGQR